MVTSGDDLEDKLTEVWENFLNQSPTSGCQDWNGQEDTRENRPLFLVRVEPTRNTYHQIIVCFFFGAGIGAVFAGQHLDKPRARPQKGDFYRILDIQMI
jgi:hypothetical protein